MGLLNALVTLVSFVGILWSLSGSFSFDVGGARLHDPGLHGVGRARLLHRRQPHHAFHRPAADPAEFRSSNATKPTSATTWCACASTAKRSRSTAARRWKRGQLRLRFSRVLANYLQLIRAQKNLTWFTVFFGQAATVFPLIVAAPRFFSGAIQLGELMQIASAFDQVQDSLAWFVDNYSTLAAWRATADRLTSFEESVRAQEQRTPTLEHSTR